MTIPSGLMKTKKLRQSCDIRFLLSQIEFKVQIENFDQSVRFKSNGQGWLSESLIILFLNFLYFLRVFVFFMRSAASTCLSCRCSFIRFFSDRLECAELSLESLEFELEEDVERLLRFSDFFFDLKISLLLSRYINLYEIFFKESFL